MRFEEKKGRTAQARQSTQIGTGTASVNPCPAYALLKSVIQLRVSVRLPRKRDETDPPLADRRPVGDPGSQTPLHSTATPPRARPARTLGPPTKDVPNALPPHGGALGRKRFRVWKFCRWRRTERKPTVLHSIPVCEAEGPANSATMRTAPRHHWAKAGCHHPWV